MLLLTAGCTRKSYRLRVDHDEVQALAQKAALAPQELPPVPAISSQPNSVWSQSTLPGDPNSAVVGVPQGVPARFAVDSARGPLRPTSPSQHNAAPQAGSLGRQSHVRRVIFNQEDVLPAPPPEAIRPEEVPPSPAVDDELIVLPTMSRPPGFMGRILSRLRFPGFRRCAHGETELLSIKSPPFSPSGKNYAPNRWWILLGDPGLNYQVESSLDDSFTLAAALQRLRAAQALARREASNLWPDVNGVGSAEGAFSSFSSDGSLFSLGLAASYEVDLWGNIESRVEAERLRADATDADYHAVALTLSGEVARTWFSLIEARAQLALLGEQLNTNITGLKLQEKRFAGGAEGVGSADVLRQRQLVESTREQIIIARSRIDVLEHRLAVLQGRPPQGAKYDVRVALPSLPPVPATGLPSELLQRRPDVRREYLELWAADRDLAAAISAQYPRLNLAGSIDTLADGSTNLFRDWIGAIAAEIVAPLIDGGERRAEVDRRAAQLHELVADYGQTVLVAFREVEDALALEQYQRQRIESLNKQYKLARQSSAQLRERYLFGETEYLDVLTAITGEQRLQREILSARLELILTRVALYLALAGGFDPHPQAVVDDNFHRDINE